jgi:hypothetical protein
MGVYEYQGEPGLGYHKLKCTWGTAPITDLQPGDLVDFGLYEPPDRRWTETNPATVPTRIPDNVPRPLPDLEDVIPDPEEDAPVADTAKRKTKTTAA